MENVKTALVLMKLNGSDNEYVIISKGIAKDCGDVAEFYSNDLGKTTYPIFNGCSEVSVIFLSLDKLADIDRMSRKYRVSFSMDDSDVKTYSVIRINVDSYDISFDRMIAEDEIEFVRLDEEEYEYKPLMDIDEAYEMVRSSVVGQDAAIKQVLSTIYFNQKLFESDLDYDKVRNLKQNILLIGDTGSGKTEMIKQIAKVLDIPCVIEDATQYTIEGYKGLSITDMFAHLCIKADYNVDRAERGILVIDEIDKKSSSSDVSEIATSGVQYSLLKVLEGSEYFVLGDKDYDMDSFDFDSTYLTVILSGSFSSLKEKQDKVIGFESVSNDEKRYEVCDLKKSGIVPELLGRMSKIIYLNKLTRDDYIKILNESSLSVLLLTDEFYKSLGINVVYTDYFIEEVARLALTKGIGARGLKTVFDEVLGEIEFDLLKGNVEQIVFNGVNDIEVVRKDEKEEKKSCEKVRVMSKEL